jgi:hypothetical protein
MEMNELQVQVAKVDESLPIFKRNVLLSAGTEAREGWAKSVLLP